jgi:hypothetical protein
MIGYIYLPESRALFPRRTHPREELIELLWPDVEREVALVLVGECEQFFQDIFSAFVIEIICLLLSHGRDEDSTL